MFLSLCHINVPYTDHSGHICTTENLPYQVLWFFSGSQSNECLHMYFVTDIMIYWLACFSNTSTHLPVVSEIYDLQDV